jgi:hypothetical protein
LSREDTDVLRLWGVSRLAVLVLSWAAMFVGTQRPRPWLWLWQNWDARLLVHVARYGYFGPAGHPIAHQVAFLPGYPLAVAAVQLVVRDWTVAALVVSLIAGTVAVLALARLAEDYTPGTGPRTAEFFLVSPAAVFLAAGYTESLFLAFALPAWLAARHGRWPLAGLLAAGACATRVEGLFLVAALAVAADLYTSRPWRAYASLSVALVPVAAYELYLRVATGDWLAWMHAEAAGWDRHFAGPVGALRTTWTAAFNSHWMSAPYRFEFQVEIVAVAAGLAGVIVLAALRHWPEALYSGLTVGVLATSTWYESVPRALLILWPLWYGMARVANRWPWAGRVYLALAVPLSAVTALLYLTGAWAGLLTASDTSE